MDSVTGGNEDSGAGVKICGCGTEETGNAVVGGTDTWAGLGLNCDMANAALIISDDEFTRHFLNEP